MFLIDAVVRFAFLRMGDLSYHLSN